jgi:hypothetical protein
MAKFPKQGRDAIDSDAERINNRVKQAHKVPDRGMSPDQVDSVIKQVDTMKDFDFFPHTTKGK